MRVSARRLALILVLLTGTLWAVVEIINPDGTPESWLLLKLFHSGPKFYELKVSLNIQGDAVSFTRTIECKPKFARGRSGNMDYSALWYPARYLVSHALADGSGVMVVVPRVCNVDGLPPSDFVPTIFWTDNAHDLKSFEAYIDPERLLHGGLRVKLLGLTIAPIPDAGAEPEQTPTQDFADQLNMFGQDPSPDGKREQFFAIAAIEQGGSPSHPGAGEVPPTQAMSEIVIAPLTADAVGPFVNEVIIATYDRFSGAYNTSAPPDVTLRNDRLAAELGDVRPFRPGEDGAFAFQPERGGVLYFVRSDLSWCGRVGTRCITAESTTLSIDDDMQQHYLRVHDKQFIQFNIYNTLVHRR